MYFIKQLICGTVFSRVHPSIIYSHYFLCRVTEVVCWSLSQGWETIWADKGVCVFGDVFNDTALHSFLYVKTASASASASARHFMLPLP